MVWIYILSLDNGKYYIGKSKYPLKRVEDHKNGFGSKWTCINKVISVVDQFEGDDFDEDKYVKIYMKKYGIDNVRGGSYCREKLSYGEIKSLTRELNGATDSCFRCGRNSHFVTNCYASKHIDGSLLRSSKNNKSDDECDNESDNESESDSDNESDSDSNSDSNYEFGTDFDGNSDGSNYIVGTSTKKKKKGINMMEMW